MLWVLTSTRGHFTSLCHQTDIQDGQSEISSCRSGSGVTGHYACADELATAKLKRQSDLVSGFHRYQQKKGYKKMCICQTPIAIPKKGNVEMHFWTVHKKCNTDFPPKKRAEADTEASLRVSHSIKREDAGMNIAVAKQFFFSVGKRQPSCPYKLWGCATNLKAAHLNSWLHGLTFLCWSAVSLANQLLA